MKKLLFLIAAIVSLSLTACDECKDISCMNGGTCEEGVCDCPNGYSGELCEDEDLCITNNVTCVNGQCNNGVCECDQWYEGENCDDRVIEKYDGLYIGTYSCSQGTSTYSIGSATMSDIEEENEMKIKENSGRVYSVEFTTNKKFDIPSQSTSTSFGELSTVSGSGEVSGNDLEFQVTYTYAVQGSSTTCSFTGSN
ncbi:MAG: calcium-binding EGF-like domain-containing protein [Flavobacteriales bacterium]